MDSLLRPSFTDASEDGGAARALSQLAASPATSTIQAQTAEVLAHMKSQKDHPPLDAEFIGTIFSPTKEEAATSTLAMASPPLGVTVTTELEFDTALDLINIHKQPRLLPPTAETSSSRVSSPMPISPSSEFSDEDDEDDANVAPAQKSMYNTFEYKDSTRAWRKRKRNKPPGKIPKRPPTSPTSRKSTPLSQAVDKRKAMGAAVTPGLDDSQVQLLRRGFDPLDRAPTWVVSTTDGIILEYKTHKLKDTILPYHPNWKPASLKERKDDIHYEVLQDGWLIPCQEDLVSCNTERQKKAFRTFYTRLNELRQYIQHYGDANVPQQFPPAHSLGIWVNKMRMEKKKFDKQEEEANDGPQQQKQQKQKQPPRSNLTHRKVELLEYFGFIWAQNCKGESGWEMRFKELKQFRKKHGHCDVPTKCSKNRALGRWVSTQRAVYKVWQRNKSLALGDRALEKDDRITTILDHRGAGVNRAEVERRINALQAIGFNFSKLAYGEMHVKSKGGTFVLTYLDKNNKKLYNGETRVTSKEGATLLTYSDKSKINSTNKQKDPDPSPVNGTDPAMKMPSQATRPTEDTGDKSMIDESHKRKDPDPSVVNETDAVKKMKMSSPTTEPAKSTDVTGIIVDGAECDVPSLENSKVLGQLHDAAPSDDKISDTKVGVEQVIEGQSQRAGDGVNVIKNGTRSPTSVAVSKITSPKSRGESNTKQDTRQCSASMERCNANIQLNDSSSLVNHHRDGDQVSAENARSDSVSLQGTGAFHNAPDALQQENERKDGDESPEPKKPSENLGIERKSEPMESKDIAEVTTTLEHLLARTSKIGTTRRAKEGPVAFLQSLITFMSSATFVTEHQLSLLNGIARAVDENAQLRQQHPLRDDFQTKVSEIIDIHATVGEVIQDCSHPRLYRDGMSPIDLVENERNQCIDEGQDSDSIVM